MVITWKCGHKKDLWGADRRKAEKNCKWAVCPDCYAKQSLVVEKSTDEIEAAAAMSEIETY